MLTIASHHHEYRSHNCLTIHNSKVIARNIPALPEQRVLSFQNGTRVTVRDLFGSMPVRVKQRATELDRLGSAKSFDQLVFTCVGLLLAWPTEITLSLRDTLANRTVVLRTSKLPAGSHNRHEIAREVPSRTCSLLGQASLLEREDPKSWVSIGASVPGVSLSGCVCLVPVATKRVQFIALGVQPLLNENQSNVLYEEVNKVFANSSFGVIEEVELDEDGFPKKTDGFTAKELKPKRGIDRWPMFFIQITLEDMDSLSTDELIDDTHHNLNMITDLLQVMVYEFLKKHHFHPRGVNAFDRLKQPKATSSKGVRSQSDTPTRAVSRNRSHQSSSRSPAKVESRKSRPSIGSKSPRASRDSTASPFASWARVKSSTNSTATVKDTLPTVNPTRTGERALGDTNLKDHQSRPSRPLNPLFDKSGNLLRKPFDDVDDGNANEDSKKATEPIVWIDPATKIRSLIDPRTGFKVKPNQTVTKNLSLPELDKSKTNTAAGFLKESLSRNLPPVKEVTAFKHTEPVIPRVPEIPDSFGQGHDKCTHNSGDLGNIHLDLPNGVGASATVSGRLSKDALRNAEILGQVDKKFILAKLSTAENAAERSLLILIDQHAADERCRVEDLMKGYFRHSEGGRRKAQSQAVNKPLRFDLSQQEGRLLTRYQRHFQHWGVRYEVFTEEVDEICQEKTTSGNVRVEIQSLPPSIIERCRAEPRLLVDLVRKEIWKLHDNPGIPVSGNTGPISTPVLADGGGADWFSWFHHCPEGILEMINSRSCRSELFLFVLEVLNLVDLLTLTCF